MATVRQGDEAVLLVVDLQVGVMEEAWNAPAVVQNVALAVAKARTKAVPVIWVQHEDEELVRDGPRWHLVPELVPAVADERIHKKFNSCFEQTQLEPILAKLGASHIVLAGAATNWCIRATAYAALERGYDLTLIEDAHTTSSMEFQDGMRVEAASIVRDLNIAIQWLSYPGRSNRCIRSSELDFAP